MDMPLDAGQKFQQRHPELMTPLEPEVSARAKRSLSPEAAEASPPAKKARDTKKGTISKDGELGAATKEPATSEATTPVAESYFKAQGPLHLNLNLKLGSVYSAGDLRRKCAGDSDKVAKLEKFMKDPTKLAPVAPPAPKPQAQKKVAEARVEAKPAPKPEPIPEPKRYLAGQIVWHAGSGQPALAKVVSVPSSPHGHYGIRHIAEGGDLVSEDDCIEVTAGDLTSFDVKELPLHMKRITDAAHQMPSGAESSAMSTPSVGVPEARDSQPFVLGQIVWHSHPKRPSWPARVQMLPLEENGQYRIQLFNIKGGFADGEVLPASTSDLLAFERDDMPAYYQAAKAVHDAVIKGLDGGLAE